jgi:hypothetical protein
VVYIKRKEVAPNKIRLSVKEYNDVVTLEVYSETVYFPDYLSLFKGKHKETFRFDLSKRSILFKKFSSSGCQSEEFEIGNPFQLDLFEQSILGFFKPNSLANSNQGKELNHILKVLRETVHKKLEKRLGHKISSMYVSPGQYHGTFLLPILNIAYRVICPDAPNLPERYRENENSIKSFWMYKGFNEDVSYMEKVIALRRKKSFIPAMISVNNLPDTPFIRRALRNDPFDINLLKMAFRLCKNYDYAVRMFEGLKIISSEPYHTITKEAISFLRFIKVLYKDTGEDSITRMVEEYRGLQLFDCANLYRQLNKENRRALKTESVKLRDLHDWMSIMHKKQTHKNLNFDVPEHIVKRLSMQTGRLSFFLPEESMQLLIAGHELHNCVASYGAAMKNNQKWIVLVADDKGKLAACLEIKEKELVQAKLDRNKPVSSNVELNKAIVAWAKEAKIKINTSDIKVPGKKKTVKTECVPCHAAYIMQA